MVEQGDDVDPIPADVRVLADKGHLVEVETPAGRALQHSLDRRVCGAVEEHHELLDLGWAVAVVFPDAVLVDVRTPAARGDPAADRTLLDRHGHRAAVRAERIERVEAHRRYLRADERGAQSR